MVSLSRCYHIRATVFFLVLNHDIIMVQAGVPYFYYGLTLVVYSVILVMVLSWLGTVHPGLSNWDKLGSLTGNNSLSPLRITPSSCCDLSSCFLFIMSASLLFKSPLYLYLYLASLADAVLTCTHNQCFEHKITNINFFFK